MAFVDKRCFIFRQKAKCYGDTDVAKQLNNAP